MNVREGGKFLHYARTRRDTTMERLSSKTGISMRELSELENGLIQKPSLESIDLLAKNLGFSMEDYLEHCGVTVNRAKIIPDNWKILEHFVAEQDKATQYLVTELLINIAYSFVKGDPKR
jgi:transcriptional regulator with XRE-family HTH domain